MKGLSHKRCGVVMEKKEGKFKKWLKYNNSANKGMLVCLAAVVIYTGIMLAIIYGFGGSLFSCSSGSLTNTINETAEIETSVNRPVS